MAAKNFKVTDNFERALDKLDNSIFEQVRKIIEKIKDNPEIGKPMRHDRKGTRELYVGPYRLSYAYEKSTDTLFILDIYHKDEQ